MYSYVRGNSRKEDSLCYLFAVLPECRFCYPCPHLSGVALLVSSQSHIPFGRSFNFEDVLSLWLHLDKQKEPITQSIRNRRERGSRFKMMFYVIGSENLTSDDSVLCFNMVEFYCVFSFPFSQSVSIHTFCCAAANHNIYPFIGRHIIDNIMNQRGFLSYIFQHIFKYLSV